MYQRSGMMVIMVAPRWGYEAILWDVDSIDGKGLGVSGKIIAANTAWPESVKRETARVW
jgi:hypothetical protein